MSAPILIFGATGGVGSALARRLAEAGHSLALSGRNEDALHSLADDLGATAHPGDVLDDDARAGIIDAACSDDGGLTAPLALATMAWFGKPCCTAMVMRQTLRPSCCRRTARGSPARSCALMAAEVTCAPEADPPVTTIRVILGDQLSPGLSSLCDIDKDTDVVLMAEVMADGLSGDSRKSARFAASAASPRRGIRCSLAMPSAIASDETMGAAMLVFIRLGATTLTRMSGARSAARARPRPSTAPLALATMAWLGKPC